jgi:hypothetical protein
VRIRAKSANPAVSADQCEICQANALPSNCLNNPLFAVIRPTKVECNVIVLTIGCFRQRTVREY